MKRFTISIFHIMFSFLLILLLSFPVKAVTTTNISVQNLGTTPVVDSTVAASSRFLTYRIPMTSDSALAFPNDDYTFIVLFDSSGASATTTITKPTATIRTSYGDISLSDLTCTTVSALGNIAFWQIPKRFNDSNGRVSIYTSSGDYINISVFRLTKY